MTKDRLKILLCSIRTRCENGKSKVFKKYGGRGIENHLSYGDLVFLWNRDSASKMKIPSIDRINNDGDYILSNCRFIEHAENAARNKRKSVIQLSMENKVVKVWASLRDAAKGLGYSFGCISGCCLGKRKTHKGFSWKFQEVENVY